MAVPSCFHKQEAAYPIAALSNTCGDRPVIYYLRQERAMSSKLFFSDSTCFGVFLLQTLLIFIKLVGLH